MKLLEETGCIKPIGFLHFALDPSVEDFTSEILAWTDSMEDPKYPDGLYFVKVSNLLENDADPTFTMVWGFYLVTLCSKDSDGGSKKHYATKISQHVYNSALEAYKCKMYRS